MTNVRVGQDLLEHQHRLEEEEATRKRVERLEQDKKSSAEKFEEVLTNFNAKTSFDASIFIPRSFAIGKVHEPKKFLENYTK